MMNLLKTACRVVKINSIMMKHKILVDLAIQHALHVLEAHKTCAVNVQIIII